MYKKLFFSLGLGILLSASISSSAQCDNVNGDFESFTGPVASGNAWINSNLDNWSVSHGSPSIGTSPTMNMWMWSYSGRGEGVYTDYSFVSGETYEICYSLWRDGTSNPASTFRAELSNGLTPQAGTGTTVPTPAGNQTLTTQPWTGTGSWVTITETIVASGNYAQLWLYPFLAGAPSPWQAACRIDSVCVKHIVPCDNLNGDMESFTGPVASGNTWINNNLDNWSVSHGSPSISTSPTMNMWMWSYSGRGEGIYTDYSFVSGQTYTLCYSLWRDGTSNPTSTFRAELSNGLTPQFGTGTTVPTPAGNQNLTTQPWTGTGTWVTITETFTATGNFSQLWLYPFLAGAPSPWQAACRIDSVCIKPAAIDPPVDPCEFEPRFEVSYEEECGVTFTNITAVPPGLTIIGTFWTFGDGSTGTGSPITHFYGAGGAYEVCMTVWMENEEGEQCCITVCETIDAPDCNPCDWLERIEIRVDGSNPFTFSAEGLPGGMAGVVGYHWDFGDGNTGSGQSVTHTYAAGGGYEVCLTVFYYDPVTRECCSITICTEVDVRDGGDGGVFEEDGGRGTFDMESPELEAEKDVILNIFPNPSDGNFTLEMDPNSTVQTVNVYDQSGKMVYRVENTNATNRYVVDLSSLDSGLYIIVVNENDEMRRKFDKVMIR